MQTGKRCDACRRGLACPNRSVSRWTCTALHLKVPDSESGIAVALGPCDTACQADKFLEYGLFVGHNDLHTRHCHGRAHHPLSQQLNRFFDLCGPAVSRRYSLVGAHRTLFVATCHWLQSYNPQPSSQDSADNKPEALSRMAINTSASCNTNIPKESSYENM